MDSKAHIDGTGHRPLSADEKIAFWLQEEQSWKEAEAAILAERDRLAAELAEARRVMREASETVGEFVGSAGLPRTTWDEFWLVSLSALADRLKEGADG